MKKPSPWYTEIRSGGGWFVKLGTDQYPLGKHPEGSPPPHKRDGKWNPPQPILDAFYKLMALRDTSSQADYALDTICGLYLEELAEEDATLSKRYEAILGRFCDHEYKGVRVGKLLVNAQLDTEHLKSWARTFPSDQTQRTYINCCKAALTWAVNKKSINVLHNPLLGVKSPKVQSRSVVISREEHQALLGLWDDEFRDFLIAMWFTGARPAEIARIEKRHYKDGLWRLDPTEHKTGDATGMDRVIGVVGELIDVVERLCKQHSKGRLFRNTCGRPWNNQATFVRFQTARRKKLIREEVVPYSYRHAWATHALEAGNLTEYEVAKALGHQTTQMVMLHYDHSRRNPEHLRTIFEKSGR
jgi:integrase